MLKSRILKPALAAVMMASAIGLTSLGAVAASAAPVMTAIPANAAATHSRPVTSIVTAVPHASAAVPTASPRVHTDILCSSSGNACEEVANYAQGSDYVYFVEVWDNNDTNFNGTYRLLVNGGVRYSANSNGAHVFNLDYNVNAGYCIQGGIEGLTDARTPCWYAP